MGRIIDLVKPLQTLLPEVTAPKRNEVGLAEKLTWSLVALLIYLVCSQMPLYGIPQNTTSDPFYLMRMILASSKGSLMELGISPIITSGMIMQLLSGAKIIAVDTTKKEDQALFSAASKLLGILITAGEAVAYVLSGQYGDLRTLGATTAILLIVQLFAAGVLVMTLDDMLSKGWGISGGINLFIVTNICEGIVWKAFSPTNVNGAFEGVFPSLAAGLFTDPTHLHRVVFRDDLPNVLNLAATVVVFLIVVYIQGWKVEVPLELIPGGATRGATLPDENRTYSIKLFYTSNMPIILLSALISNLYFFSQVLHRRYPTNILVNLLGRWSEDGGAPRPVGGASYYVSPPRSFTDVVDDPFRALFYIVFMLSACALFAKTWIELTGSGPEDIHHQLKGGNVQVKAAYRDRLNKYIPVAAAFGGTCVAALSIFADLLGAIGSGTGILMCVTIIYELYEKVAAEAKEELKNKGKDSWLAQFVQFKTTKRMA